VFAALADALRSKGDLDQAFRVCRQGLRLHPNYGAGHLVMAKINFERKMYDWAEQELAEAVRFDGETRATDQLHVEIMIARGNVHDSELALKKLRTSGANPLMLQDLQQRVDRLKKDHKRRGIDQALPQGKPHQQTEMPEIKAPSKRTSPITLSQALDELLHLYGVQFIVCAHANGTVVDHRGNSTLDITEAAAFAVEMCRNAQTETALNAFGNAFQIAVETEERMIVIMKFDRYNLVLFCDKRVNLGSMRLKLDEIAENLQDA
jgi:predicted regulator of Ras-like GTPase activity (Roadblock/LC7/MglB family)